MPEPREPIKIPLEEAKKLSPEAFTARIRYESGKREREEAEAAKKEQEAAQEEARRFIDNFLDNPEYRTFLQLLQNKKMEEAEAVAERLIDQMDQLASKSKTPEIEGTLSRIKDRMVVKPLEEAIKK